MSTNHEPPKRVCAYYSSGPHFRRVLAALRERYPGAHLTALAPPRYPREMAEALADGVVVTAREAYDLRNVGGILALLRQIRGGNYDCFVVMFDSPKLQLLAWLTGIPKRYCQTLDGRYLPLRVSIAGQALKMVERGVRGRWQYWRLRRAVLRHPVRGADGEPLP